MFERALNARPREEGREEGAAGVSKKQEKRQRAKDIESLARIVQSGEYEAWRGGTEVKQSTIERTAYWLIRAGSFGDISSREVKEMVPFTPHRRYVDVCESAYEGAVFNPKGSCGIPNVHEKLSQSKSKSYIEQDLDIHKRISYLPVARRLLCNAFLGLDPMFAKKIVDAYSITKLTGEEVKALMNKAADAHLKVGSNISVVDFENRLNKLKKYAPEINERHPDGFWASFFPLLYTPAKAREAETVEAYVRRHAISAEEMYEVLKTKVFQPRSRYPEQAVNFLGLQEGGKQKAEDLKFAHAVIESATVNMDFRALNEAIRCSGRRRDPLTLDLLHLCTIKLYKMSIRWPIHTFSTRQNREMDLLDYIKTGYKIELSEEDKERIIVEDIKENICDGRSFDENAAFRSLSSEVQERVLLKVAKQCAKAGLSNDYESVSFTEKIDSKRFESIFFLFESLVGSKKDRKKDRVPGEEMGRAVAEGLEELMGDTELRFNPFIVLRMACIAGLSDEDSARCASVAVDHARAAQKEKASTKGEASLLLDTPWQVRASELAEIFGEVHGTDGSKTAIRLFEACSEDGGPPLRDFIAKKLQKDEVYTAWRALRGFLLSKEVMERYNDDIFYLVDQVALRAANVGMLDVVRMFDAYIQPRIIKKMAGKGIVGQYEEREQEVDRTRFEAILKNAGLTSQTLWQDVDLAPFTLPNEQNQT